MSAAARVSSAEAAKLLGIRPHTLEGWRSEGRGPCFLKIGRAVFYSLADIDAWVRAQRRDPKAA